MSAKKSTMSQKSNSFDIKDLQDIPTPVGARLAGIYKKSFAYITLKDRLPIILTKVIDTLSRDKENIIQNYGQNASEEIKQMIGFISQLKNELVTNKPLKPLPILDIDANNDAPTWNKYLQEITAKKGEVPTWFNTDWLYCECYMYRALAQKFLLMTTIHDYDPFQEQKRNSFTGSLDAIKFLSAYTIDLIYPKQPLTEVQREQEFYKLLKLNLWGNKCDLSLSAGSDSSQTENPIDNLHLFNDDLISDDSNFVWQLLSKQKPNDSDIVDIVHDNAGYEYFTDLCVAIFLTHYGLAGKIRFYVKCYPWYISDVTRADYHWMLEYMKSSSNPSLQKMATIAYDYFATRKWTVETEGYWTGPYEYTDMKEKDKILYAKLSEAKLVIFKGDLNYRKLLSDINWDYTTRFTDVLRNFRPTNILSIRTVKSDVCVGLPAGKAEELYEKNEKWMYTGQYGLIQASVRSTCNCSETVN